MPARLNLKYELCLSSVSNAMGFATEVPYEKR